MAKTSMIMKNEKRQALAAKFGKKRAELRAIIKNPKTSDDARAEAYATLRSLPRDSSATRTRNRCQITGRPRGYVGRFGLSRIAFRELALRGEIPGVRKASW